jgi:hypothetical protein
LETAALPTELHPCAGPREQYKKVEPNLLRLPVSGVLTAPRAELLDLDPIGIVLLVLDRGVVPLLAGLALEGDGRSEGWHFLPNTKKTQRLLGKEK